MGDRDLVDVGADDRGDRATGLGEPLEEGVPVVHRRAADPELVVDDLGHRGGRLGGHRADRARVQVDARAERRQRLADRGHLLGIGQEGGDHAPMISAMSSPPAGRRLHRTRTRTPGGLARPELLASTDWLADQLGRPGRPDPRRPLAARRQRPPGLGRRPHPGRGLRRLAGRPDRHRPRPGETLLLAGPEQVARTLSLRRRRRRRDGRRLRRHASACSPPASGGASGSTGSSRVRDPRRRLSRRGSEEGRPVSNAVGAAAAGPLHAARPAADAPDDGRRPGAAVLTGRDAPRRPGAGRVPRPRGQRRSGSATSRARSTCRSGR